MILQGSSVVIGEVPEINFGTILYQVIEGSDCAVISMENVTADDFAGYVSAVKRMRYNVTSKHSFGDNTFYVFTKDEAVLYLSFYPGINQMRLVGEKNDDYLTYRDVPGEAQVTSLLTQIDLEDFGLSYIVRLADGRFIIFDGGWDFEPDADKLMNQLRSQSPDEKPVIAAWIFTHPHIDHYRCFMVFYPKYREQVVIQRYLYNFPELTEDCVEKHPDLGMFEEVPNLHKFAQIVAESQVPVVRPHTGQIYEISNARLEILSSLDDTCKYPSCGNALSLFIKMIIAGQTIMFCADGYFEESRLAERYGSYLKSDILQITHHGFNGGCSKGYRLIDPKVCIVPVDEDLFYCSMGYENESNRTLLYDLDVQEMFTGSCGDIVLQLPYEPRPNGKKLMLDKTYELRKGMGAKSWFFADLTWEECKFSFLSMNSDETVVYADLFFEDPANTINKIKITLPSGMVKKVSFANGEDIDGNALFFNRAALAVRGVPVGKQFTVRFVSTKPVVIWGEKQPVYFN